VSPTVAAAGESGDAAEGVSERYLLSEAALRAQLAVLLGWMAQSGKPVVGMVLLTSFGAGQVLPLLLAGTAAASLPSLLNLRQVGQWVPPISGVILVTTGALTLVARWL
jgi:cytochrome c-type biogenesis protein